MSLCCTEIAMGQVMHRMRLTWLGGLVDSHTRVNTFKTVLALVICYHVYDGALSTYLYYNLDPDAQQQVPVVSIVSMLKDAVSLLYSFWSIYVLCKTRQHVRETYSIPEQYCTGAEDCLCSTFCSCCTVAQIARHTGDYDRHPSYMCTDNGLPDHAPVVV
jgi:Cys-rich protein (TIGR01571 family)